MKTVYFLIFLQIFALQAFAKDNGYQMRLGRPLPANQFIELAKKINPTVVNISTTVRPQHVNPFFEQLLELYGLDLQQPQKQEPLRRHIVGTGFLIDSEGLILTNSHVIKATQMPEVQLIGNEKKYYPTEIIGNDSRFDIALIKIKGEKPKDLPFAKLGDSDKVQVGEWVAAFGNPFGHSFSVSKGIISAKQRHIEQLSPVAFLQTDASINPGNSGGPLVNMRGEVIGVNTAIDARAQGIGFAIPINVVKKIKPQLQRLGYVVRGYLGVGIEDIGPRAMQALGLSNQNGALVLQVESGSPADKAGVRPYDVIIKFNDKDIKGPKDLINAVRDSEVGKRAILQFIRKGKRQSLRVMVGSSPQQQKEKKRVSPPTSKKKKGLSDSHQIGLWLSQFSEELAQKYQIENAPFKKPIVTHVQYDGVAWKSGLREGDMILDVNRQPSGTTAQSIFRKLKKGQNILRVFNRGKVSLVFIDIS